MEMKEINYVKSCNACGSECIGVDIEQLTQEDGVNAPLYRIILRCNKCNEIVEIMRIYIDKVQVTVNQDVEDIFDATKEEELKCELANAKAELATVKGNLEFVEKDLDRVYTERNTYKALLMDIYKLSNKGGNRNA